MDDPIVAEASRITALRDQWLIQNNKTNPDLQARLKKAKAAEKKVQAKLDKNRQKAQELAHIHDIRRLAIGNRQISSFRDNLSDPAPIPSSDPPDLSSLTPINQTPATRQSITSMRAVLSQQQARKKAIASRKASGIRQRKALITDTGEDSEGSVASQRSKRARSLTPPPVQMELIRPGKRRVKVTANAVESTPSKRMKKA